MQRVRQRIRHTAHVDGGGLTPEQSQQIGQIEGINNRLTTLTNVAAKTNITNTFNANQTITGQLLLNGNISNPLKIVRNGDTWFGWYNTNGTRRAYFGFPNSSNDFELKNELNNGNICFSTTGNNARIILNGATDINGSLTARNAVEFGTVIKMGYGGNPTIQPDDDNNKTLNFVRFDLNIGGKKITNVATPTANNDAANKAYVDSKLNPVKEAILNATSLEDLKSKLRNL